MNGTEVLKHNGIPDWEISGFVEYIKSGQTQGDMLLVVPEGAYAVRLGNEASIKQRVSVIKGMYYSLTFSAARTCAQEEKLNVSVAPDSGVLPMQTLYSSNGWDSYAWAYQAEYDYSEIVIHNPGVEEDPACGPLIDSIAIKALYPPKATSSKIFSPFYVFVPLYYHSVARPKALINCVSLSGLFKVWPNSQVDFIVDHKGLFLLS